MYQAKPSVLDPSPSQSTPPDGPQSTFDSQSSLNERLIALAGNPNLKEEMKEANAAIRSLIISVDSVVYEDTKANLDYIEEGVNLHSFAYSAESLIHLKDESDNSLPKYPLQSLSKWNYLKFYDVDALGVDGNALADGVSRPLLDSATVQLILATFSGVTDLTFVNASYYFERYIDRLIEMLKNDGWSRQLTTFRLVNLEDCFLPSTKQLFKAINELPVLEALDIKLERSLLIHRLPILGRLKKFHFSFDEYELESYSHNKNNFSIFLRSLARYGGERGDLQVDLPNAHYYINDWEDGDGDMFVSALVAIEGIRVLRLNNFPVEQSYINMTGLVLHFPWLTSIFLKTAAIDCRELFRTLEPLEHLAQLGLEVDFTPPPGDGDDVLSAKLLNLIPRSPTAQLKSVKGLDLFNMNAHYHLEWLNLPVTMPNLQAIHFLGFNCRICNSAANLQIACSELLLTIIQTRVPFGQVTFRPLAFSKIVCNAHVATRLLANTGRLISQFLSNVLQNQV